MRKLLFLLLFLSFPAAAFAQFLPIDLFNQNARDLMGLPPLPEEKQKSSPTAVGKHDFRNIKWGMSPEAVRKAETTAKFIDVPYSESLSYRENLYGLKGVIEYGFESNRCVWATYSLEEPKVYSREEFSRHKVMDAFVKMYGDPYSESENNVLDNAGWRPDFTSKRYCWYSDTNKIVLSFISYIEKQKPDKITGNGIEIRYSPHYRSFAPPPNLKGAEPDFRRIMWGMSPDEVSSTEDDYPENGGYMLSIGDYQGFVPPKANADDKQKEKALGLAYQDFKETMGDSEKKEREDSFTVNGDGFFLQYNKILFDKPVDLTYFFYKGKCVEAVYHYYLDINTCRDLIEAILNLYGKPTAREESRYLITYRWTEGTTSVKCKFFKKITKTENEGGDEMLKLVFYSSKSVF